MSIDKKAVFVDHVNWIVNLMLSLNTEYPTRIVFNKHLQGLLIDKVRK